MELLDRFKRQGKHVLSFTSFCGGLPLPENAHVPLGYKFSWRPQGVLTAALNEALYLLGGKVCALSFVLLLAVSAFLGESLSAKLLCVCVCL